MIVLGVDPGLASMGLAAVELPSWRCVALDATTTKKSHKKRGVRQSDDDMRRLRELVDWTIGFLVDVGEAHSNPMVMCVELPAGSKGARAAAALAMGKGLVATLAAMLDLPIAQCMPVDLKKAVCGNGKASKADVQRMLVTRFGNGVGALLDRMPDKHREHAADALGTIVACKDNEVMLAAQRAAINGGT